VYKSEGRGREAESRFISPPLGERLILRDNGEYELWNAEPTKPGSVITGRWSFTTGDSASVNLDHSGYPVELHGDMLWLIIDNDVGVRYEKRWK